ncbi:MAG: hypothetical protein MUF15_24475 [Acidobacteria bacterium]|nr:hypothetical protein [Acidobacteriota bacterium]
MYKTENLDLKMPEITAVDDKRIKRPKHIPPNACIMEANTLYHWARQDKETLIARGLSWELVEDLVVRQEALSEAEALWNTQWQNRTAVYEEWNTASALAYELRDQLAADFRFAFRNHPDLLSILKRISTKKHHPTMLQDLNDLSHLGKMNRLLLEAIGFDTALLEKAAQTSSDLAALLAKTNAVIGKLCEVKKIRDQAYTYLKEAVDEIRRTGQFVFRHNKERFNGYISQHLRFVKSRQARNSKKPCGAVQQPAAQKLWVGEEPVHP